MDSSRDRRHLERKWKELCFQFLPVVDGDSIWRYSRTKREGDLAQGWKLHISTTVLNAPQILERVGATLSESEVQFKAPRSLADVLALNSGLLHTYSQVGKSITVYPRNDHEAVSLAQILHKLTYRFKCPAVPFDLRFGEHSNIYYRYGAFTRIEIEQPDRSLTTAIRSPSGDLMPDLRNRPKPDWATDPFMAAQPANKSCARHTSLNSIQVLRALVQRGKGGVYQAIDMQSNPPRRCLLKEGRRHGELDWDGRDGASRVRHEERVLSRLAQFKIKAPKVYSRFEVAGNVYLVMEFVDGETLHNLLLRQRKRLPIRRVIALGIQLAGFLAQMHRAGWAWRDCKPSNLIVNKTGRIVPIDFEGAERVSRPDRSLWGTPGFIPLASRDQASRSGLTDDLYALGSILFLMVTGQMHEESRPIRIVKLRHNIPLELSRLVESLLSVAPQERPAAKQTETQLTSILQNLKPRQTQSAHA